MTNDTKEEKKPITKNKIVDPKKKRVIPVVSIVIASIAMIISLWTAQNNHQTQTIQPQLEEKLTDLANKQKELLLKFENKAQGLKQFQNTIQTDMSTLHDHVNQFMNQKLHQNQDWVLLKAKYYLELAQINAHWSDNYAAAASLLKQADTDLEPLSLPKILEVRQAIAKEMEVLKTTPRVDITGLLSQLDAIQDSIQGLSIQSIQLKDSSKKDAPATDNTKPYSSSNLRLHDTMQLLEKMVIVRRDDDTITPLLSPLYESTLKESIQLNLQQAQWAILNNNPIIYQWALKHASTSLKRLFNVSSKESDAILNHLNALQKINIQQEKPSLELALPLLNQIINHHELGINSTPGDSKGEP